MRALTLLAALAAPALAGDEKPDPKGEAVSGRITFKGKPLAGGTVTFASKDGKTTVAAAIDAEGAY
ncbi:MAG TPA: carboxypeptidase regulatory-like domain-containing protein, partial [Gemmata sp.]|nr:carboxypeptidase regulatory-like domain-containing protein [Gemmata sp.]